MVYRAFSRDRRQDARKINSSHQKNFQWWICSRSWPTNFLRHLVQYVYYVVGQAIDHAIQAHAAVEAVMSTSGTKHTTTTTTSSTIDGKRVATCGQPSNLFMLSVIVYD